MHCNPWPNNPETTMDQDTFTQFIQTGKKKGTPNPPVPVIHP